ncbi:MAG: response regulator [Acidobacteriota bacterium]
MARRLTAFTVPPDVGLPLAYTLAFICHRDARHRTRREFPMFKLLGLPNLSLKRKLVVVIMATTLLALFLASAIFQVYDYNSFRRGMVDDFGTLAETLQATVTNALVYNNPDAATQVLAGLEKQPHVLSAGVYDQAGELFAEFSRTEGPPETLPEHCTGDGSSFEEDSLVVHRELAIAERPVGHFIIRTDLVELRQRLQDYLKILAAVIFGVSLIALFISNALQRSVSEPILDLARVARAVSVRKDYSARAKKAGEDEIGRLTDDFNHMLAQIQTRDEELLVARDTAEQANRSKSVFLASMSHELRTPLTAIIGYSEILEDDAEEMGLDDFVPDLHKIKGAGKHLLGLINSILDLSKVEAGKMDVYVEEFEIQTLVEEVCNTVLPIVERNGNHFEVECADDLPNATGDLTKTRQILFNLLSNASKFTEKGSVRLEVVSAKEFDSEWFVFRVIDSGIGMTAEQRRRLFKPFSQADASTARNYGGTGLGLALCKRFCELMGGWIDVESTLGKGSTFTVWMPQVVQARTNIGTGEHPLPDRIATSEWQQVSRRRRGRMTETLIDAQQVLVIDDDPAVHDLLRGMLEHLGFRVGTARNGRDGLERAKLLRPDIILLDIHMPEMDGWEVLGALKADSDLAATPVILISVSDERQRGYALGAEYLAKPIDRGALEALLKKYRGDESAPRCLVVDDDAGQRRILRAALEEMGWAVQEAEHGLEALRSVASTRPQLILLDLIMPQLDGFGFLAQLRKNTAWREIPVAVLTAMDLGAEERSRLSGGVERVLQKDAFNLDDLRAEIHSLAKLSLGS